MKRNRSPSALSVVSWGCVIFGRFDDPALDEGYDAC